MVEVSFGDYLWFLFFPVFFFIHTNPSSFCSHLALLKIFFQSYKRVRSVKEGLQLLFSVLFSEKLSGIPGICGLSFRNKHQGLTPSLILDHIENYKNTRLFIRNPHSMKNNEQSLGRTSLLCGLRWGTPSGMEVILGCLPIWAVSDMWVCVSFSMSPKLTT